MGVGSGVGSGVALVEEDGREREHHLAEDVVLEVQGGYRLLDSAPVTITGQGHRPAYGTDGDYFSKPNVQDVFEGLYKMLHEAQPARYPLFF